MSLKKETLELINDYKRHWSTEFINRFKVVQDRFEPILTKPKKVKGEYIANVEVKKTEERLKQRLSTYSVPVTTFVADHAVPCVHSFHVAVVDDSFKVIHSLVPLAEKMMQPFLRLTSQITGWVITTHALGRFLERNNTTDISSALKILAYSMYECDRGLGLFEIKHNLVPRGYAERQIKCSDGGMSFILIHDPSDCCYRTMEWVLVTYISPDMVKGWNEQAATSEFENLETRSLFRPSGVRI